MNKLIRIGALALVLATLSCSHSKPRGDGFPLTGPSPADPNAPVLGAIQTQPNLDDYLNHTVLPKIVHSSAVHECFLDSPKAKKRELAKRNLGFHFEIKLEKEADHVIITRVYLTQIVNLPIWAKPCVIEHYEQFKFPPFPDPNLPTASAFGDVNMSWKWPKR